MDSAIVLIVFAITLYGISKPLLGRLLGMLRRERQPFVARFNSDFFNNDFVFALGVSIVFIVCITVSLDWELGARLVPVVVGTAGLFFVGLQLLTSMLIQPIPQPSESDKTSMDLQADFADLSASDVRNRALRYFGWCLFVVVAATVIGLLPALFVFLLGFTLTEGRERWIVALTVAVVTSAAWYFLFHQVLRVPWPAALLGDLLPVLRSNPLTNVL